MFVGLDDMCKFGWWSWQSVRPSCQHFIQLQKKLDMNHWPKYLQEQLLHLLTCLNTSHEGHQPSFFHSLIGMSPGTSIQLCTKNYEQLRYLHQLLDDGIVTVTEKIILSSLKNWLRSLSTGMCISVNPLQSSGVIVANTLITQGRRKHWIIGPTIY